MYTGSDNHSFLREDGAPYGVPDPREAFRIEIKARSKALAVDVINLMNRVKFEPALKVVQYQLIKSATSVGANYRAVCRARSDREFYAKLSIVVEEADETVYWLEILLDSEVTIDKVRVAELLARAEPLSNLFSKSRATLKERMDTKGYRDGRMG